MLGIILLAVPLAITWMMVTAEVSLGSFVVGWLLGIAILWVLRLESAPVQLDRMPSQVWALIVYTLVVFRDVVLSTWDVTRRVLHPKLPLNPGIIAVPTQDTYEDDLVGAFSAHGITITPGELVVDYSEDEKIMFVHCLDVDASTANAEAAQKRRLGYLNRILGREERVTP